MSTLDAGVGAPPLDAGVIPELVVILVVIAAFAAAARTVPATVLVAAGKTLVADDEDRNCAGVPLDGGDAEGYGSLAGWVCDSYS